MSAREPQERELLPGLRSDDLRRGTRLGTSQFALPPGGRSADVMLIEGSETSYSGSITIPGKAKMLEVVAYQLGRWSMETSSNLVVTLDDDEWIDPTSLTGLTGRSDPIRFATGDGAKGIGRYADESNPDLDDLLDAVITATITSDDTVSNPNGRTLIRATYWMALVAPAEWFAFL